MAVTEEDFRKALEDLVHANIVDIFNIKYGETLCPAGEDVSVAFQGEPYDWDNDFLITIVEAFDIDGIDIKAAVVFKTATLNGFVVNSPRNTIVKWTTTRKIPKINFWTE